MDRRRLALLAVLALLAGGSAIAGALVGADPGSERDLGREASQARREQRTSFLAGLIPPAAERSARGPAIPRSISDLARRLPLERKVAQMFLFGFPGQDLTAPIFGQLRRLDLGGIVIERANYAGPLLLGQMAGEAVVISQQARHVPPWVMAPQEGGEFSAFSDLPPDGLAGDMGSPDNAGAQALESASSLRALGVTGVLTPVVDVGLGEGPSSSGRVFSDDPDQVADYATQTVRSYNEEGVFSAPKHFPGLGSASQPTEAGPAQVGLSFEELRERDLVPFQAAFRAAAPAVVIGNGLYPSDDFTVPASLSKRISTDLLRNELGFRGVAITDDLADPAVTALSRVPEAAVEAVNAGADMLQISGPPGDQQAAYVAVLRAVRRGTISRDRVDEALLRILLAKRRYGVIR